MIFPQISMTANSDKETPRDSQTWTFTAVISQHHKADPEKNVPWLLANAFCCLEGQDGIWIDLIWHGLD